MFALIGMAAATTILYSMGLFSFTLMGLFSGVLLGSGVHDFAGQWVKEADDSDVAWSKVSFPLTACFSNVSQLPAASLARSYCSHHALTTHHIRALVCVSTS